jgi:hypothetical protein
MKLLYRIVVLCIIFIGIAGITEGNAQKKSRSMRQIERRSARAERSLMGNKSRKVMKAERKAEKTKEEQKEGYEQAKKKDKKHRMEIQTENTRQMMKETDEKSENMRKQRREPFFKRLFKRKPR